MTINLLAHEHTHTDSTKPRKGFRIAPRPASLALSALGAIVALTATSCGPLTDASVSVSAGLSPAYYPGITYTPWYDNPLYNGLYLPGVNINLSTPATPPPPKPQPQPAPQPTINGGNPWGPGLGAPPQGNPGGGNPGGGPQLGNPGNPSMSPGRP